MTSLIKEKLPTFYGVWQARQKKRANRLPKHLRAPTTSALWLGVALNVSVLFLMLYLMWNRDDFPTEAGPAAGMVIGMLILFYTVPTAVGLCRRFAKIKGRRIAKLNVVLMVLAAISFPVCIAYFLP